MTVADWLRDAATRLLDAGLDLDVGGARLEARVLAGHGLGVERAWLVAHDREPLTPTRRAALDTLLARRLAGEPVAYLLGEREFHGRPFQVGPDVLIPRPETEHLVEAALAAWPAEAVIDALDIGTGSGAIAITLALERPAWRLDAVDLSAAALALARANAEHLGARVDFHVGDLYAPIGDRRFHLIVSNPPYIAEADPHLRRGDPRFEPRQALAAGADGLDVIRRLVADAPARLHAGGRLLIEHGHDQGPAVAALLLAAGFTEVDILPDLAGLDRIATGTRPVMPARL